MDGPPKLSLYQKIQFSCTQIIWGALSLLIPRRRPLEVTYGRVRYCLAMFDDDMTVENCARNWFLLFNVMNKPSLLAISSLYGDEFFCELTLEIHKMEGAGGEIYERRDEDMTDEQRAVMVGRCWRNMKREIHYFLQSEDEDVTPGAKQYCESLKAEKYQYDNQSTLHYPFFSL